ncbi:MAG: Gfo/Idh/MocA family oxidoreductase [Variibacter sp.]|nr:Gfo/Idh/MocA family oxidoreductase [Variibacter sp.]
MLRIAVIGLGWWGRQIVSCLEGSPRFRVVAAYDVNRAAAEDFAAQRGLPLVESFDAALARPDVDAVAIVTPHAEHEAQVLAAVAAGKQVFCEKPLALSAASAERMLEACARAGAVLGVGHERRYEPALEEVQRLCGSGTLGRLMHLDANVSHDIFRALDPTNWRLSPEHAPAGAMTALGIHLTDLFIALAGRPARVAARTARHVFAPPADDYVAVDIDFENGISGRVTCLSATPFYGRFTAYGDKGWVEVQEGGNVDKGLPTVLMQAGPSSDARIVKHYEPANTVLANFEAWADAVEGRAPYRFTPDQMLANVKVLEAVIRSAAAGGTPIAIA